MTFPTAEDIEEFQHIDPNKKFTTIISPANTSIKQQIIQDHEIVERLREYIKKYDKVEPLVAVIVILKSILENK